MSAPQAVAACVLPQAAAVCVRPRPPRQEHIVHLLRRAVAAFVRREAVTLLVAVRAAAADKNGLFLVG